jgi:hypothetical protein
MLLCSFPIKITAIMKESRSDKERNRELVQETMVKYYADHGKFPTSKVLQEFTGLHFNTVCKHMKNIKFEPMKNPLRLMTPDVLAAIYRRAVGFEEDATHFSSYEGMVTETPYIKKIAPDVSAQKLWLQVMEGWKEKSEQDVKHSGSVGFALNYVVPENPDEANHL